MVAMHESQRTQPRRIGTDLEKYGELGGVLIVWIVLIVDCVDFEHRIETHPLFFIFPSLFKLLCAGAPYDLVLTRKEWDTLLNMGVVSGSARGRHRERKTT